MFYLKNNACQKDKFNAPQHRDFVIFMEVKKGGNIRLIKLPRKV